MGNLVIKKVLNVSKKAVSFGIQYYILTTIVDDLKARILNAIEKVRENKEKAE